MKLRCPVCESRFSLDQFEREAGIKDLLDLAAFFGKNWNLISEYVEMFRAQEWGSVRFKRRLELLKEIRRLFEKCEFNLDRKRYRTDLAKITAAIRVTVDTEKHGFKNHHYLLRVLTDGAERLSAEGLSVKDERAREETRRAPKKRVEPEEQKELVPLGEYLRREGIKSLADKIGRPA